MEDDDEPLPPRSLKDQVQEAYAAENMHLARVLHLKLHGIEVTSDDDPRIAQVRDEDFDFGHLELDEDMLEAMREAEAELKARRDLEAVAPKSLKGRVVRGQPTASSKRGHARKLPPSTLRISVSFYYKFQLLYKLSNTFFLFSMSSLRHPLRLPTRFLPSQQLSRRARTKLASLSRKSCAAFMARSSLKRLPRP